MPLFTSTFSFVLVLLELVAADKMLSHKCFLPILALCFLMDEVYSFLLPDRQQLTRSSHRLGRDLSPHLSELSDLVELIPENGGEMTRDWEPNPARSSATFSLPVERISTPHTNTHHRNKDKRLRVTVPLDRIGSLYLSSRKSRKDEPEEQRD
ncbi:hypothetical protein PGIGA_G00203800 [Pangasianodon gigas]|uniref:Uncharacterized protein n=1 Tax=Pangasianodon gigas TaxID=30993 RepID=A0ACC5WEM1_PANGG|nr:hypothetical protein [Pangasianodon gigas]